MKTLNLQSLKIKFNVQMFMNFEDQTRIMNIFCFRWKITWVFTCPLICVGVFIFSIVRYAPAKYLDYEFPVWGEVIGLLMVCSVILIIPLYIIYKFAVTSGTFTERMVIMFKPHLPPQNFREKYDYSSVAMQDTKA